jgi:uncharacterized damage-inducible protein DinB
MEHDELQGLLDHMAWADASTWKAVSAVPGAEADRRLCDLLYHLHTVQWVYLQVWRGETPSVPEISSLPNLPAIAAWARPYYRELSAFTAGIGAAELSQELKIPWASEVARRYGSAAPATLGQTVLQVVLHTTYHRAQVASRLRELGGEPPVTDFIAWVWQQQPRAEW